MSTKLRRYQTVDDVIDRHRLRLNARTATGKTAEQILADAIRDTWKIAHDRGIHDTLMRLERVHPLGGQIVADLARAYRNPKEDPA